MNSWYEQAKNFFCIHPYCGWIFVALGALLLALIIKLILSSVSKKLHPITLKTRTIWDTVILELFDHIKIFVLFFWIFFVLSKSLDQSEFVQKALGYLFVILTAYQVSVWGFHLLKNWYADVLEKKMQKDPSTSGALGLLYRFMQAAFILLVILIALSNLNINVGALLAGLGVGGIAVALAAQNVLGDLLASLSIVLDKPFCVGDLILTGTHYGTVEQIGIKTTRLRSVFGEEIIISNRNLLDSRVQNYKRMQERRSVQKISVLYSTPPEIIESIPAWIKSIVDDQQNTRFERCHLKTFGESALEFELMFYVLDPTYPVFMTAQQKVLLEILKKFNAEGVQFAFPTRTVFLEK